MTRYAVAYCRVSSEDQRERATIVAQVNRIETYASANNIEITEFYLDDGITGMKPLTDRPAGARLLKDARAGRFSIVLVYSHDRLGRDLRNILNDEYELKQVGVTVCYITQPDLDDTPESELAGSIFAVFAGYDRKKLLRRMNDAKRDKVKAGKWPGGIAPYGYMIGEDGFLHINEDEAEIVRLIYSLAIEENLGEALIAERLNELHIPNCFAGRRLKKYGHMKSDQWNRGRVSKILRDRMYCGQYTFGKTGSKLGRIEFDVPPIVSRATFELARAVVKKRQTGGRRSEIPFLLRGRIRCGACGRSYCGATTKFKGVVYRYYRCKSDTRNSHGELRRCGSKSISADWAEETIWADVERFITRPESVLMLLDQQNQLDLARIDALHRRASELDALLATEQEQRSRVLGLYRRGLIDEDTVQQELAKLAGEMGVLEEQKATLLDQIVQGDRASERREAAKRLLDRLRGRLATLSLQDKQEIIGMLVEQVIVVWDGTSAYLRPTYCFGPLETEFNELMTSGSK